MMSSKEKLSNSESSLFNKFMEGDDYAFAHYYKLYFNDLYSYGISLGAGEEQLKDLIQDVFYRIYFDKRTVTSGDHLRFYLLRSIKHGLYDLFKKDKYRTILISEDNMSFTISTTVLDDIVDEEERISLKQKIDIILSTLTDRQREAIHLRYILELEYSEIAEILGVTPHGARKLISRAFSRVRESGVENPLSILIFFLQLY